MRSVAAPTARHSCSRSSSARVSAHGQPLVDELAPAVEQQRVLAQPLREDAFRQSGHQHDAERAAARRGRGPHEHVAVAATGRLVRQGEQARREHVARLAQRHRADGPERRHRGEHAHHAGGLSQHARRDGFERLQPVAPRPRLAPAIQLGDDRQREVLEVRQLFAIAEDGRDPRRVLVLVAQLAHAQVVLVGQPPQTPLPAVQSLDDVGLDQQLFPAPRRAQRPGDDAVAVPLGGRWRLGLRRTILRAIVIANQPRRQVVGGRRPAIRRRPRTASALAGA